MRIEVPGDLTMPTLLLYLTVQSDKYVLVIGFGDIWFALGGFAPCGARTSAAANMQNIINEKADLLEAVWAGQGRAYGR